MVSRIGENKWGAHFITLGGMLSYPIPFFSQIELISVIISSNVISWINILFWHFGPRYLSKFTRLFWSLPASFSPIVVKWEFSRLAIALRHWVFSWLSRSIQTFLGLISFFFPLFSTLFIACHVFLKSFLAFASLISSLK